MNKYEKKMSIFKMYETYIFIKINNINNNLNELQIEKSLYTCSRAWKKKRTEKEFSLLLNRGDRKLLSKLSKDTGSRI